MNEFFEVRPLQAFTAAEIWPIIQGYETLEIYAVEKHETDLRTVIDIFLVSLDEPFRDSYFNDFSPEECQWHLSYLGQGYSFGAYRDNNLIGFVLAEPQPDDHLVRIWEFHVAAEYRRMGVGRALMGHVIIKARQHPWRAITLETQNTNVHAIRFYRSMGFSIASIDLSPAHYLNSAGVETGQVAFYMQLKLG